VEIEEIEFMWKDGASQVGDCPALYRVPGGYVVQGKQLSAATLARLRDLGADEGGVFVPDNVLDRLRD
jgi:hypothetical protein